MFLVRSRATLAAAEPSDMAAYCRQDEERVLRESERMPTAACCLHSHLVNMPKTPLLQKARCKDFRVLIKRKGSEYVLYANTRRPLSHGQSSRRSIPSLRRRQGRWPRHRALLTPPVTLSLPFPHSTYYNSYTRTPRCAPRRPNERRTARPQRLHRQQPQQSPSQRHLPRQTSRTAASAEPPLPTPYQRARILGRLIPRRTTDS